MATTYHAADSNLLLRYTDANNWSLHAGQPEQSPCFAELADYASCYPGEEFGEQLQAFAKELAAQGI